MSTFQFHAEPLQEQWLDAYGHLNEAYYLVPFSNATWPLQDHFNIGKNYFVQSGCAIYTVETHLRYLQEVRFPADMVIESMILGSDEKRIWFAHQMLVNQNLCATAEFMVLHYDTKQGRTSPMPEKTQEMLGNATISTRPDWIGSQIKLKR